MPISLFDDLKLPGYHSSILTTFSVDPAFYDANIQYRLRVFGCQNNLLMADASMLERALDEMPEAFVQAGRKYIVVPIDGPGCFHPKIMLRYGASKARMVLGSANATSAGWGSNREVLSVLEWSGEGQGGDPAVQLNIFAKAHDWLISRMQDPADPDLAYKLSLLETQSPWLAEAPRTEGVQRLADGSLVDLLLSDPSNANGLGQRFATEVEGEVQRLVIVSPYWDGSLGALRELHSAFGSPPVHIFLTLSSKTEARQSTFPVTAMTAALKAEFHPLGESGRHRFLHAKLIMAQTNKHDYLLYGSANCTIGALGRKGEPGLNHEAVIFRRLNRGTIDRELKLDYGTTIPVKDIGLPEEQADPEKSGRIPSFHPGRVERKGDRLIWSCPADISAKGAVFLIAGARLRVETHNATRPFVQFDRAAMETAIIVRVELADGRTSRPVIVSDPDLLRAAAPGPLAGGLRRKLDAVLSGDIDLIHLARDVHLIFEQDGRGRKVKTLAAAVRGTQSVSARVSGQDYDTPEAFRHALDLKADLRSSIAHPENPALQLILQIVLRGIVELEGSRSIDQSENEALDALGAGEDQDDAGEADGATTQGNRSSTDRLTGMAPEIAVERSLFERNRSSLVRSIDHFERHVEALTNSNATIDLDFVTRTLFMIYLMLYGSSRPYAVDGATTEVLIPFSGIGTDEQGDGFLMRSARLINRIWGRNFQAGLMARLPLDRERETLPVPVLTLVILTRWILAAILSEARRAPSAQGLAGILEKLVPKLFSMTYAFAVTDPMQIEAAIRQMAQHIGMSQLQAGAIRAVLRELSDANVDT